MLRLPHEEGVIRRNFVDERDGGLAGFIMHDIVKVFGEGFKIMLRQQGVETACDKRFFFSSFS